MPSLNVIRTLTTRAAIEGDDRVRAGLQGISNAQDEVAASSERMATVTETSARRQTSVAGEWEKMTRRYDPAINAMAKFEQAQRTADRALAQGSTTLSEHGRVLDLARSKLGLATTANDNHSHSLTGASQKFQIYGAAARHAFDQLASGASPIQALTAQTGHLLAAFDTSKITSFVGALRGIPAPILGGAGGLLAGLGVGALAYNSYVGERTEQRRSGLGAGRGSGLTPDDYREIVGTGMFRGGTPGGLSESAANDIATGIGATGYGSVSSIRQALAMTKDLAATLKESTGDAGEQLTNLFRDPVKGLEDFNDKLKFATPHLRELVDQLSSQGQKGEAAEAVMTAMNAQLGKYSDLTSGVSKATGLLGRALSDFWSQVGAGAAVVVEGPTSRIKTLVDEAEVAEKRMAKLLDDIRDRAGIVQNTLGRGNILAQGNPLQQAIYGEQLKAGVQPGLTNVDREAISRLSDRESAERKLQAAIIARQVTEQNDIGISKQLTEQRRTTTLTLESEIAVVGKSGLETDRARYAIQAFIQASAGGKDVNAAVVAQIDKEAGAYAKLADNLRRAQFSDQIKFDRGQLGRDSQDQAIATQLRGAGLGSIDDVKNRQIVSDLRTTQELNSLKTDISGSLSGVLTAIRGGTDPKKAIADQAGRLADQYLTKTVDKLVSGAFSQFGLDKMGLSTSTTGVMNVNAATVNVTGGVGTTGALGSAATATPGGSSSLVPGATSTVTQGATSALTTASRGDVRVGVGGPPSTPAPGASPSIDRNNPDLPQSPVDLNTRQVANAPGVDTVNLPMLQRPALDLQRVIPFSSSTNGINPGADTAVTEVVGGRIMNRIPSLGSGPTSVPTGNYYPLTSDGRGLAGAAGAPAGWMPSADGKTYIPRPQRMEDLEPSQPTSGLPSGWNFTDDPFTPKAHYMRPWLNDSDEFKRLKSGSLDDGSNVTSTFADNTSAASKSLDDLGAAAGKLPDSIGSAQNSLGSFASSLFNFKPSNDNGAGGFSVASLFGGSGKGFGTGDSGGGALAGATETFATGGYTGLGGKYQPAGVVHRGEFVFSAASVDRIGLGVLDGLHRGLPGFAGGGLVGAPQAPLTMPFAPAPSQNFGGVTVHHSPIYNITPAKGVTLEQLAPILDEHGKKVATRTVEHVQRHFGKMAQESRRRTG